MKTLSPVESRINEINNLLSAIQVRIQVLNDASLYAFKFYGQQKMEQIDLEIEYEELKESELYNELYSLESDDLPGFRG